MKILEIKALRGPNFWSVKKHRLIQMTLDLEDLEYMPTNKIPGFYDRLKAVLPSLYSHECSEGVPGGFFARVQEGTWMGHVIEHVALEMQSLAGIDTGFGRTRGTGTTGVYHVVFAYGEEEEGSFAAKAAVQLAEAMIAGQPFDLNGAIDEIRRLYGQEKFGPSTNSIVEEAKRRNIPWLRLDNDSLVQLGYGRKQKRIQATLASTTSSIAVDIAGNKDETKRLLTAANIPVPQGEIVDDVEKLGPVIERIGFPVVMKPLNGNHGNGATINITSEDEAYMAFRRARKFCQKVIVEKYVTGRDFRVLLIDYKFVAAAMRTPASVTGDGVHTIGQLIDRVNADPARGQGHNNILTRIDVNDVCLDLLGKAGLNLESVVPAGKQVLLKPTANLSTGGTATDVTDAVHPANVLLFERAARTIGLDICGIDVMSEDLITPLRENGGAILEVNAAPGFRMHLEPTAGQPRNVAAPVIDMLFRNNDGRIPIVAITGTNGKTTTTRLIAAMAQQAGFVTGYTTTDGIYINNELVERGDCAGPGSAQFILKDPTVDFAVLETARGGILRSGLGFDACSCAVVTNVAEDHLGLQGIDTIEKLAKVKAVVPESVEEDGYAILNADDDRVYAMKDHIKSRVALFSLHADNIRIEQHCAAGGIAAIHENGYILIRKGNHVLPVEELANVPITFGGRCEFNIANALAASLAAYTSQISIRQIRQALRSFVPSSETTPGRVNVFEFSNFRVVLDYAHNPHGVRALGSFINTFNASMRTGVITGVGDRRDEDIIALGEEAAKIFDRIIIRHDDDLRGRKPEEMNELLMAGIRKVSPEKHVTFFPCELEACEFAIANAVPGSVVVVLVDHVSKLTACIRKYQQMEKEMVYQKAI